MTLPYPAASEREKKFVAIFMLSSHMSLTFFPTDDLIIKWFVMIHRWFSVWLKRVGGGAHCALFNDDEAFCRNINFPFFTLMFCVFFGKLKIKNNENGWNGKFKGSTFFLLASTRPSLLTCVLYYMGKSLCLSIIYDKYIKKESEGP